MENKVGKQIQNKNGNIYTVIALKNNRALLVGGHDYVVIEDFDHFEIHGVWGNGTYFPWFKDENSEDALNEAFYYFKNFSYQE